MSLFVSCYECVTGMFGCKKGDDAKETGPTTKDASGETGGDEATPAGNEGSAPKEDTAPKEDSARKEGSAPKEERGVMQLVLSIFAAFFAIAGFLLLLGGNFWCDYATQDVSIFSTSRLSGVVENQFTSGLWNYQAYDIWLNGNDGTISVNSYKYCVPYSNAQFDYQWQAARSFAIIAAVFGGIMAFAALWVFCVSLSPFQAKAVSGLTFITILFQGLTFLYFPSNGCEGGEREVTGGDGYTYSVTWSKCSMTNAAYLSIASLCSLFVGGILMLCFARGIKQAEAEHDAEEMAEEKRLEKNWIPTFMKK